MDDDLQGRNLGGEEDEARIEELSTLLEDPPAGLHRRVRASIQRRLLVSDVADFSVRQVMDVIVEFLKMAFETIGARGPKREDQP
ncbi:MAG: hypothetical protein OEO23_02105 [Gemmatimonadota bacterium]|nr:hypothetical protein [Gemmatimonadota bacterium]